MYISNPNEQQKIKWYQCSYWEGDYIIRKLGISPIFIDDIYMYFVQTEEFRNKMDRIPNIMKFWTAIKKIRIKRFLVLLDERRRKHK